MARADSLEIALMIPGCESQLEFVGEVRYRRLSGAAVQYGIRFDESEPGFEEHCEHVRGYVDVRRGAMLKRLGGAKPETAA